MPEIPAGAGSNINELEDLQAQVVQDKKDAEAREKAAAQVHVPPSDKKHK